MVSNAFRFRIVNGVDLYGVDMCVQAMLDLARDGRNDLALCFVIADTGDAPEQLDGYDKKTALAFPGDEDRVLLWKKPLSFVRLLERSDLYIRPTNSDGDALSIREAHFFGKNVVTSDVVSRPDGCFVFPNRDQQEFDRQIQISLSQPYRGTNSDRDQIAAFYRNLYNDFPAS